jgi:hypothetical protein
MPTPRYPSLYQINTRVWLTEIAGRLGRAATLDDVSDEELDRLAQIGFDWVWLLSAWGIGTAGRAVSRSRADWRTEFQAALPDLRDEDIAGSGFAIAGYTAAAGLGGPAALARMRARLRARGLRLMLDFVPNHTALDHPWVEAHPDWYIQGTDADLGREPDNYTRLGDRVFAYGRDPSFAGWPDTLQLDYSNPDTQDAMRGTLAAIAAQCDGVRCDMAMLVLPEVFERTWRRRPQPFWQRAVSEVRTLVPGFCFMAEAYWDLEWRMQQDGFDYVYDKPLYDRLRDRRAGPLRQHLHAGLDYQDKLARFLENHDEPRAAAAFPDDVHQAAAVIAFLSPGLRFFHQGQFEGRRTRISPHLVRAPQETPNQNLRRFYDRLLAVLRRADIREGAWQLLECAPAWDGNATADDFVACAWQGADGSRLLIAVNYADTAAQCYVRLPWTDLGRTVRFADLTSDARYERAGSDLAARGLYLDLGPWAYHVFETGSA